MVIVFTCFGDFIFHIFIYFQKPPGILLGAQPASEICFFCKKRVYLMERMNAEGVFFHRGCLKCDFCETGLRMNNYSCERTPMTGQGRCFIKESKMALTLVAFDLFFATIILVLSIRCVM